MAFGDYYRTNPTYRKAKKATRREVGRGPGETLAAKRAAGREVGRGLGETLTAKRSTGREVGRGPGEALAVKRIVNGPKKGKPISLTAAYGYTNKGPVSGKQKNTVKGSPRFGQTYKTVMTPKGAVHEYEDGSRVLLKGGSNATRTLKARASAASSKPGPGNRITEDDPRWNASTMGDKTGMYKGRWYNKGKKTPFDRRGQ